MPEVSLEQLLVTLSGDLAGLRRRVEALETQSLDDRVTQLSAQLTELLSAVQALQEADRAADIRVFNWSRMDQEEAAQAWKELLDWLRDVLTGRYPVLYGALECQWKPCWYQHPEVVEELSWLYTTWRDAYDNPAASPTRAAEWHDRWLPGVLRRIDTVLRSCGAGHRPGEGHKPREYPALFADDAELSVWIEADVAKRPEAGD